jgi:hypothetical protein
MDEAEQLMLLAREHGHGLVGNGRGTFRQPRGLCQASEMTGGEVVSNRGYGNPSSG